MCKVNADFLKITKYFLINSYLINNLSQNEIYGTSIRILSLEEAW